MLWVPNGSELNVNGKLMEIVKPMAKLQKLKVKDLGDTTLLRKGKAEPALEAKNVRVSE